MNRIIYFVLTILLLSMLAQWSLRFGVDWLQFSREDIENGQWWRFITGNWVHLTWRHWMMNAFGHYHFVPQHITDKIDVFSVVVVLSGSHRRDLVI